MATTFIGITMAIMDGSIANVALPTIATDFGISPSTSIWIINAYQLAVVASLLPFASLGEIIGYRRVYLIGLFLFTLASLACGLSGTIETLVGARVAQGLGASGIMSVNLALIRHTVPSARLGRTIGINAMLIALSSTIAPTLASFVLTIAKWPWLFVINLPLGLVGLAVGLRALPQSQMVKRPFDIASAALNAVTFGCLLVGVNGLGRDVHSGPSAALIAAGLAAAAILIRRQFRLEHPLVPIDLLRNRTFALSVVTSVCCFAAQMLASVTLPFHLQHDLGFTVLDTGLIITGWPVGVAVTAPLAGRLVERFPAGILGTAGLIVLSAGLILMATLPPGASAAEVVVRAFLCGAGFGLFQTPNNRTLIHAAPRHRSGAASGMLATSRLTGQMSGAVLVAIIMGTAAPHSASLALFAGAFLALAGAVASALRLRSPS